MYTDEQLEILASELNRGYETLYQKYLRRIGERIKTIGDLRPTEINQLLQLKNIKADVAQMKRDLARLTGKTVKEIDEILMNAAQMNYTGAKELYGYRNIPFVPMAKNKALFSLANAISRETAERFYNLSNTTGNLFEGEYKKVVDEAVKAVSSGVSSYSTEIYNVLKDMPTGLKVLYDSGYKRRFDSALRMNIIDGTRAINQQIQDKIGEELGCDGVELSAHALCAPDHLPYQGRQYSKEEFAKLQATLHRRFGIWNCKHTWNSIILGVSEPVNSEETLESYRRNSNEIMEIDGKEYTRYEASQLQRKLETEIRAAKEMQILGKASGNERLIADSGRRITQCTAKYNAIADKASLQSQLSGRARVQGYRKMKVKPYYSQSTRAKILAKAEPDLTLDSKNKSGNIVGRSLYSKDGLLTKQIHPNDHGNAKNHPFGEHGEHTHEYIWKDDKIAQKTTREMTDEERKDNGDIL